MNYELILGDSSEKLKDLAENSVDLTVTSPPYDNLRTYNGNNSGWGEHVWKAILAELYRVTKDGGVVVWVVGDATKNGSESGTSFKQALYAMECGFKLHDTMIYSKHKAPTNSKRYECKFEYMFVLVKGKIKTFNPIRERCINAGVPLRMGNRGADGTLRERNGAKVVQYTKIKGNIWHYYVGYGEAEPEAVAHPARFPQKLAYDHILSWSNEGDIVLDPFSGSGTTGKMAKKLKRNFIGIELDPEYMDLARRRIEKQQPEEPEITLDFAL